MIIRTPFRVSPYGPDEYSAAAVHTEAFLKAGYIWVRQDVRGRRLSEGEFTHVTPHRPEKRTPSDVDESTDTYDTVEWLLQHVPNHNGRVGMWGISYAGFFTAAGIIDTHPAIKAASPQAPVADLFLDDDWYHGGAFMLASNFNSVGGLPAAVGADAPPKVTVPFRLRHEDGYEFFLKLGPSGQRDPATRRSEPHVGRNRRASHLRRLLAIPRNLAALEEHPLRGAHRGRLVRRRGLDGTAARLSRDRG